MTTTTHTHQTCRTCYRRLHVTHFRRRRQGCEDRHRQCNKCRNAADRDRRRQIRLHEVDRFAGDIRRARSQRAIERLCTEMIDHFGGLEAFTSQWWQSIQEAMRKSPASRTVLNHFKAILELQTCAEKQRETAGEPAGDDLDQMTTQELKDELNVLIREQATEIVLEALKDLDESNCPSTT